MNKIIPEYTIRLRILMNYFDDYQNIIDKSLMFSDSVRNP